MVRVNNQFLDRFRVYDGRFISRENGSNVSAVMRYKPIVRCVSCDGGACMRFDLNCRYFLEGACAVQHYNVQEEVLAVLRRERPEEFV